MGRLGGRQDWVKGLKGGVFCWEGGAAPSTDPDAPCSAGLQHKEGLAENRDSSALPLGFSLAGPNTFQTYQRMFK